MSIIIFFSVVILFSVALNVIDKVRSYNHSDDHSVWQEGDSVIIMSKDSKGVVGGFGKKITAPKE